jgi:hypothetical protein
LEGWLFRATRFAGIKVFRSEHRQQRWIREAAQMENTIHEKTDEEAWNQIVPILNETINQLRERDRNALLLRFFKGKSFGAVGTGLGISEDAAKKRVMRALEKLRTLLGRRGVVLPVAILTATLSVNAVQAAPVGLSVSVAAVAASKGVTAAGSTLALTKGILKLMAWTKAKTAIIVGAGILLAAGTTTVTVRQIEISRADDSWRVENINPDAVNRAAPQVRILPTKFPPSAGSRLLRPGIGIDKFVGINVPVDAIASLAYRSDDPLGLPWPRERMIFTTPEPRQTYDFIATLPQGSVEALRREMKTKLGFVGRKEIREIDVLILKIKNQNAPGLVPSAGEGSGNFYDSLEGGQHHFKIENQTSSIIAGFFERLFKMPIIDQTGVTRHFNFDLKWNESDGPDVLKQALLDQCGLELVPGREPVEMLVVEKAKD